jgi:hypothetical protein
MAGGAETPHIAAPPAIARQRRANTVNIRALCCRSGLCDLAIIAWERANTECGINMLGM